MKGRAGSARPFLVLDGDPPRTAAGSATPVIALMYEAAMSGRETAPSSTAWTCASGSSSAVRLARLHEPRVAFRPRGSTGGRPARATLVSASSSIHDRMRGAAASCGHRSALALTRMRTASSSKVRVGRRDHRAQRAAVVGLHHRHERLDHGIRRGQALPSLDRRCGSRDCRRRTRSRRTSSGRSAATCTARFEPSPMPRSRTGGSHVSSIRAARSCGVGLDVVGAVAASSARCRAGRR